MKYEDDDSRNEAVKPQGIVEERIEAYNVVRERTGNVADDNDVAEQCRRAQ